MIDISNLKRQHKEVSDIIDHILKSSNGDTIEKDAHDIAKNISILAGKLKVHLGHEDKFLYPHLITSSNVELNNFAKIYREEMENILSDFTNYKNSYNTRTKIIENPKDFQHETKTIISLIRNRIEKENSYLYPLLVK